jgi:hypothetical protein
VELILLRPPSPRRGLAFSGIWDFFSEKFLKKQLSAIPDMLATCGCNKVERAALAYETRLHSEGLVDGSAAPTGSAVCAAGIAVLG